MRVRHDSKTGKTTITLSWTETRQVASGSGLQAIREAVTKVTLTPTTDGLVRHDR